MFYFEKFEVEKFRATHGTTHEQLMECTLFIAHQACPFGYIFVIKPSQRSS